MGPRMSRESEGTHMMTAEYSLYHCRLCNIIVGTHARGYCLEKARCDCYCANDDRTFPALHANASGYPHVIGGGAARAKAEAEHRAAQATAMTVPIAGTETGASGMKQSEWQFSDAVVELAEMLGWKVKRDPSWRATAASPGFPDLCMTNGKQIIFAELKVGKGRLTKAQGEWVLSLVNAADQTRNVHVRVWTPESWPEIERMLQK